MYQVNDLPPFTEGSRLTNIINGLLSPGPYIFPYVPSFSAPETKCPVLFKILDKHSVEAKMLNFS